MIYITGDTHGEFTRFSGRRGKFMTENDYLIICGDFGAIWANDATQKYWIDWLTNKPWTTLFVDGNHENFDLLYSYPVVDYLGSYAHKITNKIYHLIRGNIYTIEGKTFFAFGGAKSHDIGDGILDQNDFSSKEAFMKTVKQYVHAQKMFRINHKSWWEKELPSSEEMLHGREVLDEHNFEVDYVITHCLPQTIVNMNYGAYYESDVLTNYFDMLLNMGLKFKRWFCGHYHTDKTIYNYRILYDDIVCIDEYEEYTEEKEK